MWSHRKMVSSKLSVGFHSFAFIAFTEQFFVLGIRGSAWPEIGPLWFLTTDRIVYECIVSWKKEIKRIALEDQQI